MEFDEMASFGGPLTRPEILAYLNRPWDDRFFVTPLIDPDEQIGSNSIDLRLGTEFLLTNHERIANLDILQDRLAFELMLKRSHDFLRVGIGDRYVLHEHEFVLATTLEYISLPDTLAGFVIGRSSWDRMGISVPIARISPGFRGCVSLQVVSHASVPVALVPGTRICQLMLFPVSSPVRDQSRYGIALHPVVTRIQEDKEIGYLSRGKFPLIIGVVGTLASGKSEIAEYLLREHGFLHLSLATLVHEEARRRGLATTAGNLQDVGNSMRAQHGPAVLAQMLRPRMEALPGGSYLVIEGIKNIAEVQELRKWPNFKLIAVDAPREVRLSRAMARRRPGGPGNEEEFRGFDDRDRGGGEPNWGQGVDVCLEEADHLLENDGALEELLRRVQDILRGASNSSTLY